MRQRRDKAAPLAPDDDAVYAGIPRDANGHPIFLVLPPDEQAFYEERMSIAEAAWRDWRDPLAVADATTWTHQFRQPIPVWLEQAVVELAMGRCTRAQDKRRQQAAKQLVRYDRVVKVKKGIPPFGTPGVKMTWLKAYAEASCQLEGKFGAGEVDTMKDAYIEVNGAVEKGGLSGLSKYCFKPTDKRYRGY